ncbi:hypothetical protein KUV26_01440 [Leisingera daeponensis]|uniref:Uncharacterized protein n=1 Tax=Leisingera daeponensis TaxID=405746 RepID=A0ABS7NA69_9RHOB|nr:hypothetical protein [Leisingera daeponensis]MBY6138090.1 hypothetical protein [Leisingera daeponensis]
MATEKLTIIKADVKNEVTKKVKPKFVQLGNMNFAATVEVDKSVAKELDTDARFVAKLYDDATKEYKKLLNECTLRVDAANNLGSVLPLTDKECKELDADIKKIFSKYEKSIEHVATKHFDKWRQANKDRKKYRIKVVSAIVLGSACAIGSTASLAAGTVTGGASIAASIYGIAQSIVSVARAVQKVTSDIVKIHGELEKALKQLVSAYENQSKAKVKAKEIGKEILADFLMVETAGFNRVDKHLETYKAKLKNIDLEIAALGKELNKLLDKQSKLDKEIEKKLGKMAKDRGYKSKKLDGLFTAMEAARKETARLIKSIEAYHVSIKPAEKFRDNSQKAVDALRHKDPVWAKWVIWVGSLGLGTTVTSIASGGENLVKAASAIETGFNTLSKEFA